MHGRLTEFVFRAAVWLCTEIALTCLGLDDLADYGEFTTQCRGNFPTAEISETLISSV